MSDRFPRLTFISVFGLSHLQHDLHPHVSSIFILLSRKWEKETYYMFQYYFNVNILYLQIMLLQFHSELLLPVNK